MSIARNTMFNLMASVIPMAATLATVPAYITAIGPGRFGILAIIWTLLGFFSFADMGIGRATAQHIAAKHSATSAEREQIFWTSLVISLVLGVLGAFLLASASYALAAHIGFDDITLREEFVSAIPLISALLLALMVGSILSAALLGREHFKTLAILSSIDATLSAVIPLSIAWYSSVHLAPLLAGLVLWYTAAIILRLVICVKLLPLSAPKQLDIPVARSLFAFGGWVTISSIVGPVLATFDRLALGLVSGTASVTCYVVPHNLLSRLLIIPTALSQATFPRVAAMGNRDDSDPVVFKTVAWLSVVMTPVCVIVMLAVEPFFVVWMGQEFARQASLLACILNVGIWANSLARIPAATLQAQGRPDLTAKTHLIELLPYFASLYLSVLWLGLPGAALTWTLRVIVDAIVLGYLARLPRMLFVSLLFPFLALMVSLAAATMVALNDPLRWCASVAVLLMTFALVLWQFPKEVAEYLAAIKKIRQTSA